MLCEPENSAWTIIDIFCEFVEVAIQYILYYRKLYPESIFGRKRKYGIVVYKCVHPDVNEYILNCLKTIRYHLRKNQLKAIYLCISRSDNIIERYNFKVVNLDSSFESDPFLVKLEQYLNNFCLKLHSAVDKLADLTEDSSFTIELDVTEYANLEYSQDPAHENFLWVNSSRNEAELSSTIIPLHSIETSFFNVQTYIENLL